MTAKIKQLLFISSILLYVSTGNHLLADTIHLEDGSIIVGKIIKKKGNTIVFANTYGKFTIKKKMVKKLYKSKSYEDDIKIQIKLGKKMNQTSIDKIKQDFITGQRLKEKEKEKEDQAKPQGDLWDFHRFSIYVSYYNTIVSAYSDKKNVNDILPHGLDFVFSYDYGFDKFLKKRMMFVPGIRVDGGITFFANDFRDFGKSIIAFSINAGPIWIFPSFNKKWGYFMLSCLPGISIMGLKNTNADYSNTIAPFTLKTSAGYGYTYNKMNFQFVFNYNYIQDIDVSFHAIGVSFGISFIFN